MKKVLLKYLQENNLKETNVSYDLGRNGYLVRSDESHCVFGNTGNVIPVKNQFDDFIYTSLLKQACKDKIAISNPIATDLSQEQQLNCRNANFYLAREEYQNLLN